MIITAKTPREAAEAARQRSPGLRRARLLIKRHSPNSFIIQDLDAVKPAGTKGQS